MAAASTTVKKVLLKLGGKWAMIVLDDAGLPSSTMMAAFANCAHTNGRGFPGPRPSTSPPAHGT